MSWNDYSLEKKSELTALADAIRTKSGASGNLTVPQMKDKVDEISTGVELPTLTNPSTPSDVMSGKQYINDSGQAETGTFSLDNEITAQDTLISQIKNALQGKAAGGGSSGGDDTALKGLIERSVTEIEIPEGTTSIGVYAFHNCTGLTSVTIPDSVTIIDSYAFWQCSGLTSVMLGNGVTSIGNGAFYNCPNLANITVPNSVTSIGSKAFADCTGLTSVTIGNSITSINSEVFKNCGGLASVYITDIAKWCALNFYDSTANPLRYTKKFYIDNTPVTNLAIPDSVTSIGRYTFPYCLGLTNVTISNSVQNIEYRAFYNCSDLKSVIFKGTPNVLNSSIFLGCSALTDIYVPWSEGAVANAPWGAPNAQIHYNSEV